MERSLAYLASLAYRRAAELCLAALLQHFYNPPAFFPKRLIHLPLARFARGANRAAFLARMPRFLADAGNSFTSR
jgi:hypothetical protein